MKIPPIVRTIVFLAPLAACSHHHLASINILPVPPKDSRWEGDKPNHIHLPLTDAGRTELVTALTYGLSHDNQDRNAAVEANTKTTYGELLDLLGKDHTLADLSNSDFKKWFSGDRVDQVVDARDDAFPKSHAPAALRGALSEGKYWWIFYRDAKDHLTAVMVVKLQALTRLVEKGR